MFDAILAFIERQGLGGDGANVLAHAFTIIFITALCVAGTLVVRYLLVKLVSKSVKKTKSSWDDIVLKNRLFHRAAHLTPPIIVFIFARGIPYYGEAALRLASVYIVAVGVSIIDAALNAVGEIYGGYAVSKTRPLKGLLQVVKVVVFVIGIILSIAALVNESPLVLLGGIGALTAVTSLIFKDAILGFVAGVQLTSNDMIRIGDWIEMPKYYADGTVIDISLTTVKVQNFDRTITTIPAYALVSDAFINWRGMECSGGRRIKRSIFIDAQSVSLCDEETIERFKKIELIKEYIDKKQKDIAHFNEERHIDTSIPINGRALTNLGTFRAYVTEYLKKHPGIREDMIVMVRQLQPGQSGIPLEIYAFAATVKWVEYEGIQADIFDHLYAAVSHFGLRVFQEPSGSDIREASRKYQSAP